MMEIKCEHCGGDKRRIRKPIIFSSKFNQYLCANCLKHHEEHPVNPIPPKGVLARDEEGRVICHICGRAYDKLTLHIKQRHKMSKEEYLETYGLNRGAKLTSINHHHKLKEMIKVQPNLQNIVEISKSTRFKKGQTSPRKNLDTRLQTILERKDKKHLHRNGTVDILKK